MEPGQLQKPVKTVLAPLMSVCWRVRTEGSEHLASLGRAILAPNHTSVLDSFFVPMVLDRPMTYVGKAEYLDDWKTSFLFPALGMIPIDRSGGSAASAALDKAAEVLDRDEFFGIYPEGTRSRSGLLHKGHTGVARLALRTGAPIVPVGILGAREVQPPDAKFPRPFMEVAIRFGEPIDVTRYADRANDRLVLRQITDELMYEIRGLTGQEYVDTYATKTAAASSPTVEESPPRPGSADRDVDPSIRLPRDHDGAPPRTAAADGPAADDRAVGPVSSNEVLARRSSVELVDLI